MLRTYLTARSAARGKSIFSSPKRYRSFIEPLEARHLLSATVIEVTTTADIVDPSDAVISLREAVLMANASPEDNEIRLPAGIFTLTRQGANEDAGLTGDLDITSSGSLKIIGAGRDNTTINASGLVNAEFGYGDRIFDVLAGADVEIEAVALTGGRTGPGLSYISGNGGAIRMQSATLSIANSRFAGNSSAADGGAICNLDGQLEVVASLFSENEATGAGGAIYHELLHVDDSQNGRLSISDSKFDQNQARTGGAVYNQGWATIAGSSFTNNVAVRDGGAIFLTNYPATVSDCVVTDNTAQRSGGGIWAGSLDEGGVQPGFEYRYQILRSTVSRNTVSGAVFGYGGGGLRVAVKTLIDECLINENQAAGDGGGVQYVVQFDAAPSIFRNSTFSSNSAGGDGGAIRALVGEFEIRDSTFDSNTATNGGALFAGYQVYAEIIGSTFTDNVAVERGGAIDTSAEMLINDCDLGNNLAATGGAIAGGDRLEITASRVFNNVASQSGGGVYASSTTIRGSSIIDNSAIRGGGVFISGYEYQSLTIERSTLADNMSTDGGAVFSDSPAVHIKSSTLSGNAATNNGGGLRIGGSLTVQNSTVTLNRSDADGDGGGLGGGILLDTSSGAVLENSVIAGNLNGPAGVDTADELGSLAGSFDPASSYNLVGDPSTAGGLTSGVNGNIVGDGLGGVLDINTVLETTLADNGGPTLTHALLDGSPAVNAGDPDFDSGAVPFDQRAAGFARVTSGRVDIGAFEYGSEFENLVAGRHIFYNNSWYDWNDTNGNLHDNEAIDPSKHALLPDGTLSDSSNITSYSRGINGIMIDLAGLHPDITADDFIFRVGATNDPGSWASAPAPASIQVYAGQGVGGADRVVITWPDGVIKNTYLQVVALANEDTGLAEPDVFFFGNRVGDSFSTQPPAAFVTSAADELVARNATPKSNLDVSNPFDFDKSRTISSADMLIARNNPGVLPRIQIAPPAEAAPLVAAVPFAVVSGQLPAASVSTTSDGAHNALASGLTRNASSREAIATAADHATAPASEARIARADAVDKVISAAWSSASETAHSSDDRLGSLEDDLDNLIGALLPSLN